MGMGMGQRVNPHNLRVGVIKDFNSDIWYDESQNIDYESRKYLKYRLSSNLNVSAYTLSLIERKIKLERLLGKTCYKKVVNSVKILSR